jgi:phage baseplate assembly protein gpV
MYGIINNFFNEDGMTDNTLPSIMKAEVVNTNDPDQMGKIQVHIVGHYSDRNLQEQFNFFTWASYASPFGGFDKTSSRGPALEGQNKDTPYGNKGDGGVAYGMWAIPKVGSQVLVCAVNNDPNNIFWFSCIFTDSSTHTMPHGRYSTRIDGSENGPDGPFNTSENKIEPLYTNLHTAFDGSDSYEWRTRGADYQVSGVSQERQTDNDPITGTDSNIHDTGEQTLTENDGNNLGNDLNYRQGYKLSSSEPTKVTDDQYHKDRDIDTDNNLESSVVSITTPGFHSISMDDRPENLRVKFRTSSGHQVLLDDTNERIYVSSSCGSNYVEMDSNGHIFIYSQESISMRAEGDLNLTADKTVRVTGKEGVHIHSENDIRISSDNDINIKSKSNMFLKTEKDLHISSDENLFVLTDNDFHLRSKNVRIKSAKNFRNEVSGKYSVKSSNINIDDDGNVDIKSTLKTGSNINAGGGLETSGSIKCGGSLSTKPGGGGIVSGGDVTSSTGISLDVHEHKYEKPLHSLGPGSGITISHSGGSIAPSTPSQSASSNPKAWGGGSAENAEDAYWTNIKPSHEPWPRTFIKNPDKNKDHTPELDKDDPNVGRYMKKVADTDRKRGKLWHR